MADGHGGKRTPANPAPVSGPGQLSRRTDGGPAQKLRDVTGLPYGQNQDLNDAQAAAPLAQTVTPSPTTPDAQGGNPAGPPPNTVVPFSAPTQRPDEPVTAGAPLGPGPGPTVSPSAMAAVPYNNAKATLSSVIAASGSPEAQALLAALQTSN